METMSLRMDVEELKQQIEILKQGMQQKVPTDMHVVASAEETFIKMLPEGIVKSEIYNGTRFPSQSLRSDYTNMHNLSEKPNSQQWHYCLPFNETNMLCIQGGCNYPPITGGGYGITFNPRFNSIPTVTTSGNSVNIGIGQIHTISSSACALIGMQNMPFPIHWTAIGLVSKSDIPQNI
jgi:hypothetical protein